jgi:hypothetical protein
MKADNTIALMGEIQEKANKFILKELEQVGFIDIAPSHGGILAPLFKYGECTMTDISNNIHRYRSTLTIFHMIIFHMHESCVWVSFRITISF